MKKKAATQKASVKAAKAPALRDLATLGDRAAQVKAGLARSRRRK